MDTIPCLPSLKAVVARINNRDVVELWTLDWREITDDFKINLLKSLVFNIYDCTVRIAVVESVMSHHHLYMLEKNYPPNGKLYRAGLAFKNFCETMLEELKQSEKFNPWTKRHKKKLEKNLDQTNILESRQYKRLMKRLDPSFYHCGRWNKNVSKSFKCQIAHVLSGLLGIPDNRKWTYFEQAWSERGLAKAYWNRNGKPLDDIVKKLFHEYNENMQKTGTDKG